MNTIIRYLRLPLDLLNVLRSIDSRLKRLESCVRDNPRSHGARTYLTTGHWND